MNWISTDINAWDLPLAHFVAREYSLRSSHPGRRTGAYWVDMDTGDELLLLTHGNGNYSADNGYLAGRYHLFRHFAQTRVTHSLSHLLAPIGGGYFNKQSPEPSQQPEHVRAKCISLIEKLIGPHRPLEELGESSQQGESPRL